jgi:hypothetical protein
MAKVIIRGKTVEMKSKFEIPLNFFDEFIQKLQHQNLHL